MSQRYLIVIEKAPRNYSAHAPDLPGCVATGGTRKAAEIRMRAAIELHLQGMKEDHLRIPEAASTAEFVTVK